MLSTSTALFRAFEVEALRLMLGPALASRWLARLADEATLVSLCHSGIGYFLTVAHPMLPAERSVHADPPVVGRVGDIQAGFVTFVEGGELMFECHTWGGVNVPPEFRDLPVEVSVLDGPTGSRTGHGRV